MLRYTYSACLVKQCFISFVDNKKQHISQYGLQHHKNYILEYAGLSILGQFCLSNHCSPMMGRVYACVGLLKLIGSSSKPCAKD